MRLLIYSIMMSVCVYVSASAEAKTSIDLSKGKRSVHFEAIGKPSFLKIKGVDDEGKGLSGSLTRDGSAFVGKAVFQLDALTTGLELRDHHMNQKYLEVGKYPTAELSVTKLPWSVDDAGNFDELSGEFSGQLMLHGQARPVAGEATVQREGKDLEATVRFTIKLSDFGIEIPSFQGVTVADEVTVEVAIRSPVSNS